MTGSRREYRKKDIELVESRVPGGNISEETDIGVKRTGGEGRKHEWIVLRFTRF